MKRALVGLAAIGAVLGIRALATRTRQKLLQHCEQTASHFRAMAT